MKRKRFSYQIRIYLFTLTCCFLASSASAETVTWTCTTFQNWTSTSCWSGSQIPSSSDDVIMPASSSGTFINSNVGSINSLTIEEGVSLQITAFGDSTGDLTVINGLNVAPANINSLIIGSSTTGGILRVLCPYTVENGTRINVGANGTLQIDDIWTVNSTTLYLSGTIELNGTLQGSTIINLKQGSTLTGADGVVNIASPGYLHIEGTFAMGGTITNEGEIKTTANYKTKNISASNLTLINNGSFINEDHTYDTTINELSGSNSFINNGVVQNFKYTSINFNIPFTNNSSGTVLSYKLSFGSTFTNNNGGILRGRGFDFSSATVTNNGTVLAIHEYSSTSWATMNITGDFPFGASSTTSLLLYSFSSGSKVAISGTANVGGTVEATMNNDYNPVLGDSWEILTATSVVGTYDVLNLPTLDSGLEWYVNYSATNITLQVIETGATFEDLTITLAGAGSGTVTSNPIGIDCGATCTYSFQSSDSVNLIATADTGSAFTGWSGDTDCQDGVVSMDAAISCTATFELDSDGDGLLDSFEASIGTNPNEQDSDFDGYSDYYEVWHGGDVDTYTEGVDTDPNNPDTDGDGYYDGVEISYFSDPLDANSIGKLIRVSTSSSGVGASANSYEIASISNDGRYVSFSTLANNLVECDTNNRTDVYLKDTMTGQTIIQSTDSSGACISEGGFSSYPDMSEDGRYIVFESGFTTLVANDANGGVPDIFLKDTQTDTTTLISSDSNSTQSNDNCEDPSISGDGRYVVFRSYATNLVDNDTNGVEDIFLKDIVTGETTRVSTSSNNSEADGKSLNSDISDDGRYVVFDSEASNLVDGDTNNVSDIFLKDVVSGAVTRLSENWYGAVVTLSSGNPVISGDGNFIAFSSAASNLVPQDTGGFRDIFRAVNPLLGQTYYELSLTLAGTGSGTVTSTPAGIDCGATCSNDFLDGTLVILSATADQGSVFVGGSGDADCEDGIVTMSSAISCTATFELDSDDDGLADSFEQTLGTNPNNPDTDGDGLNDGAEFDYWGTDWNENPDGDQLINLLDSDSDNDGLSDGTEVNILGTNPTLSDTDGNGTLDGEEDFDLDEFTNFEEIRCGSDPMDPNSKCVKFLPFLMLLLD